MDSDRRAARADAPSDPPANCAVCGATADDEQAVLTWALDVSDGGWSWICPDCARDHVRAIEARLDQEWW